MNRSTTLVAPIGVVILMLLASALVVGADTVCADATNPKCTSLMPLLTAADKWQSFLGAILGLATAIVSALFVVEQIFLSDSQEKTRIGRRWRAQRAVMPMIMSRVCDYAEQSADQLRAALGVAQRYEAVTNDRIKLTEPRLDPSVESSMVAMIEAARPDEVDAYVQLLSELQVHMARWRGFMRDLESGRARRIPHDIEEELVEAAELYARASNLLAAARPMPEGDRAPTTRSGGVLLLGLHGQAFDGVRELAARYDEADPLTVISA